jgi:acetyl esterase/lipase
MHALNRSIRDILIAVVLCAGVSLTPLAPASSISARQNEPATTGGAGKVDRDVVFGMYSGLGLMMDVYHPEKPNGYGLIFIEGSGWSSSPEYNARPLKSGVEQWSAFALPLIHAGYTVFAIDHRAAPRFHAPAQIEDAQRAVRYVRYHAKQYGLNATRIGAVGYSSGAHLAMLLGLMDGAGNPNERDPVQRVSARVQCVIGGGTPTDLEHVGNNPAALALLSAFLGEPVPADPPAKSPVYRKLEQLSPMHFVKQGDPPILLVQGDADELVPYEAALAFQAKLQAAHVPVKLITVKGGTHNSVVQLQSDEYAAAIVQWMDENLRHSAAH